MRKLIATLVLVFLALPAFAQQISITGVGPNLSLLNGILNGASPIEPTATADVTISDPAHAGQLVPMNGANLKLIIAGAIPPSNGDCAFNEAPTPLTVVNSTATPMLPPAAFINAAGGVPQYATICFNSRGNTIYASMNSWGVAVVVTPPTPAPPVASPSGTIIPPATQIVDTKGNVWTLIGKGQVATNGIADPVTHDGTALLWYNSVIYVTTGTAWYSKATGTWVAIGGDPRVVP